MSEKITIGQADALIVVDVQNDFCPGGALAVPNGDAVVAPINALMSVFDHVILTQDWHPAGHSSFASSHPEKSAFDTVEIPSGVQVLWPDHCISGTRGAAFHPDLNITKPELIIRKGFRAHIDSYSTFFENDRTTSTGLGGYLRGRGFRLDWSQNTASDFPLLMVLMKALACSKSMTRLASWAVKHMIRCAMPCRQQASHGSLPRT